MTPANAPNSRIGSAEAWLRRLVDDPGTGKHANTLLEELKRLRGIESMVLRYQVRKSKAIARLEEAMPVELDHHNSVIVDGLKEVISILKGIQDNGTSNSHP